MNPDYPARMVWVYLTDGSLFSVSILVALGWALWVIAGRLWFLVSGKGRGELAGWIIAALMPFFVVFVSAGICLTKRILAGANPTGLFSPDAWMVGIAIYVGCIVGAAIVTAFLLIYVFCASGFELWRVKRTHGGEAKVIS